VHGYGLNGTKLAAIKEVRAKPVDAKVIEAVKRITATPTNRRDVDRHSVAANTHGIFSARRKQFIASSIQNSILLLEL